MIFKITKVNNVDAFCKALDRCSGNVELISDEGDRINLKSKLAQLLTVNTILNGVSKLTNLELSIEKQEDARILLEYVADEAN